MELPASEIAFWKEYYSIFPLPQLRADIRMAKLAELINNVPQNLAYKNKSLLFFMPRYLEQEAEAMNEEEQIRAEKDFAARYTQAMNRAKGA